MDENRTITYGGWRTDQKIYICGHVFDKTRPVLYVTRPDGDWCFLCGEGHPDGPGVLSVVGLGHIVDDDPTLVEILDLEANEEAERAKVGAIWRRERF